LVRIIRAALAVVVTVPIAPPASGATTDGDFATHAAQGGLAEVQAGQLAQSKGASAQVKEFGSTLVRDHVDSNNQLKQIAGADNITLPSQPSDEQRSELNKLQGLSGAAFDHQFVQDEIQDHDTTIALFQQETRSGKNGSLKAFAEKSLSVLRRHLEIAKSLQGKSP
jgi:putative membrane protein